MGWITDDGLHEGYLLPEFRDGQRGVGVIAAGVPIDQVIVEADYFAEPPRFDTRPASGVVGWRVMCDCRSSDDGQPLPESHRWQSELIARVAFRRSEDVAGSRIFAPDDEVVLVQERRDVGESIRSIWNEHHIRPDDALRILKEASARAALANRDLERAVSSAFALGLDARDVERVTGFHPITRRAQSQRTSVPRRVPGLTHHRSGPQP